MLLLKQVALVTILIKFCIYLRDMEVLGFMKKMLVAAACSAFALQVFAQESADKQLQECFQQEVVKQTAKGAAFGALAGLGKSLLAKDEKKDTGKNVLIGAVAGGAAMGIYAYSTANGKCMKAHPDWIPSSTIERTNDYDRVVAQAKYKPSQGVLIEARDVELPKEIKQGEQLPIKSTFWVLTPDGAEKNVQLTHKLFVVENGKENPILDFLRPVEDKTVPNGELNDRATLPIRPAGYAPGTVIRYEFTVSEPDGSKASSKSATFKVI